MTPEQKEIMWWAQSQGGYFTKQEAIKRFPYYCHTEKHVGDRLSRMVKAGLLERIAPGKFKIGKGKKSKPATLDNNQLDIFK